MGACEHLKQSENLNPSFQMSPVNHPPGTVNLRHLSIILTGALLQLGCRTVAYTKQESNLCRVHQVTMSKRTVPIAYGMIPMSRAEGEQGEWKRRTELYPNPGDCLPATSINLNGETHARVFVCPRCEEARRELNRESIR